MLKKQDSSSSFKGNSPVLVPSISKLTETGEVTIDFSLPVMGENLDLAMINDTVMQL